MARGSATIIAILAIAMVGLLLAVGAVMVGVHRVLRG
jgi:hypothetical protein